MFAHQDVEVIMKSLENSLSSASVLVKLNKDDLNGKTKWSLCLKPDIHYQEVIITVKVDGDHLEHVTEYKYLGVFLDVNLHWNAHIVHIASKISKRLGVLRRIQHYP